MYTNPDGIKIDPRPLSDSQVRQLRSLYDTASERKELTAEALLESGMRAGELAHITPRWFVVTDAQNLAIRIPGHEPCDCTDCMSRAEDAIQSWCEYTQERPNVGSDEYHELLEERKGDMWRPKSEDGARDIVMPPGLWQRLKEHVEEHGGWSCGRSGIWYRIKWFRERMDLPDQQPLSPHILRHTALRAMARAEVPVDRLQATAGHANIVSSQAYFEVDTDEDLAPAMAAYRERRRW
jgi:integrase